MYMVIFIAPKLQNYRFMLNLKRQSILNTTET